MKTDTESRANIKVHMYIECGEQLSCVCRWVPTWALKNVLIPTVTLSGQRLPGHVLMIVCRL